MSILGALHLGGQAEIADLNVELVGQHDVGEREVAVHNAVAVEVQQTGHHLQFCHLITLAVM